MELDSESVRDKIKIVADRIRKLRNEKGISAREMSLELGQNVNYINLIENCKRKPSLDMFLSICEYLNAEPNYFFKSIEDDHTAVNDDNFSLIIENLSPNQKKHLANFIKSLQNK